MRLGAYTLVIAVCWPVSSFLCSLIGGPLPVQIILKGIVSLAVSTGMIILFFHSTKEFKTIWSSLFSVLKKRVKAGAKKEEN